MHSDRCVFVRSRNRASGFGAFLALVLAGALSTACSMPQAASEPGPTPMPPGATWDGVYQGPYHIDLRILTAGANANGTWRALGNRTGELSGRIDGNLLKYTWTESAGLDSWSGRGYFAFRVAKSGERQEIAGEWGLGHSDAGNSWYAIKRPDVPINAPATQLVGEDNGDQDTGRDQEIDDQDQTSVDDDQDQ